MSRKILSWVLVPLTTSIAMLVGGLSLAPVSATSPPPEEPTAVDACGTTVDFNYDLYTIPSSTNYSYYVEDPQGQFHQKTEGSYSTDGVSSVTVRIMDNATFAYVEPDRVLFYTNNDPCGSEAANTYDIVVGACDPVLRRVAVDGRPTNTPDDTHKYLPEAWVSAKRLSDGFTTAKYPVYMVLDGQTASVAIASGDHGLSSGTYEFSFFLNGSSTADGKVTKQLPPCGTEPGGGSGGDHSGQAKKPQGQLHLASCHTGLIKGYTSTKGVLPKGGKTVFLYKVPGVKKLIKVKMLNGAKKPKAKVFRNVPYRKLVRLYYMKGHKRVLLSKDGNFGCGGSRL